VCYHHILPLFVSWIFTGIVVTNDGNAILRELDVAHPAAKVLLLTFLYLLFLLKLFYLSIFDSGDCSQWLSWAVRKMKKLVMGQRLLLF